MAVSLPLSQETGLPLDPTTLQALQMQQMSQNIGMQGGSAATRQNEMSFQQGLSNLFPSPQVQQAAKVQNALKQAQVTQQPGESPLDFSIRQIQAQRDAVMPYSPESAAALNTKLVQLANMKFEQQHLLAQDQRQEKLTNLQEQEIETRLPGEQASAQFQKATGTMGYLAVPNAENGVKFTAFDASNQDALNAAKTQAEKLGGVILPADKAAQLMSSTNSQLMGLKRQLAVANIEYGNYTDPATIRQTAVDAIFDPGAVSYRGPMKALVQKWYSDNGILPSDIAGAKLEYKSLMQASSAAGSREGRMQYLENSIKPLSDQVLGALGGVSRTDFSPLNSLIMKGKTAFSDPGEAKYAAAIQGFVNEYARVINGATGMTSDAARAEAWATLNKAQGPAAVKAALAQLVNGETAAITGAGDSAIEMLSNPQKYRSLWKIQSKAGYSVIPSNADVSAANPQSGAAAVAPSPVTATRPPLSSFAGQ